MTKEEEVLELLRDKLDIRLEKDYGYGSDPTITVMLLLDGEAFARDVISFVEGERNTSDYY